MVTCYSRPRTLTQAQSYCGGVGGSQLGQEGMAQPQVPRMGPPREKRGSILVTLPEAPGVPEEEAESSPVYSWVWKTLCPQLLKLCRQPPCRPVWTQGSMLGVPQTGQGSFSTAEKNIRKKPQECWRPCCYGHAELQAIQWNNKEMFLPESGNPRW